jgi:hypothetical protein
MFASPQPFFGQTVKTDSPLAAQKSQPSFSITKRDANSRVWERTTYERSPSGQLVPKKHSYTELATGMHYKDANGQWVESKEEIEVFPGGAIARQGQYQVIFANNLNTAGAIDMQMPDGKRLRSHILSLNYFDTATGNNVPLAEVKDCIGQIVGSNQVLYADAFTGIRASVRYTYRKGSFEQDVILMEQPPVPEAYGLNSASTKLQVLTEFLNPPEPKRVDRTPKGSSRNSAAIAAKNEDLDFGAMKIGRGRHLCE